MGNGLILYSVVFGIFKLTELSSYGNDKLCKRRYLPGVDFSLRARGNTLKRGIVLKGPAICSNESSCWIFERATLMLAWMVGEFFENSGVSGPSKWSRNL